MLLVMIKECTRVPCLQKGASRNSFNAKNFYSWQQVEVPNLFLWVSVTILDSFFPFVNNPRSILLNKWTSAFLLQKWNNEDDETDTMEPTIHNWVIVLPVWSNCFPMAQETTVTLNCPRHVPRVWRNKDITLYRYNVVQCSHLGCMIMKRFELLNRS